MPVTELSSLLVETFGGLSPPLVDALRRCDVLRAAAEWRKNKLTASEYEETTWSARMAFVTRRSVFPLRRSCRWRRRRRRPSASRWRPTHVRTEGLGPRGIVDDPGVLRASRTRRELGDAARA